MDLGSLSSGLLFLLIFISALVLHEWAHAYAALKLGDDTAYREGRVSLDPLVHIDILGTIVFPILCIFVFPGGIFIGWAKPVPVNVANFRNPTRDDVVVACAGPLSHILTSLIVAIFAAIALRFNLNYTDLFIKIIEINIWLFLFNMLPIPPLDGGRVLRSLSGMSWEMFSRISNYSMFILLGIFYFLKPISYLMQDLNSGIVSLFVMITYWFST